MQNLHQLFDWQYIGQIIIGGDFAKFCGLLRIYEIYRKRNRTDKETGLISFVSLYVVVANHSLDIIE